MANATPSRLGLVNNTGTGYDDLFLKVWSGEVLTTFEQTNVMMDKHTVRSISSGKSAQFPVVGTNTTAYHTVGNEITGSAIKHNEKVITIDDLLISNVFIASIDEAKNHYDVRSTYSSECGMALANKMDQKLLQVAVLTARGSATISGGNGGSVLTQANFASSGSTLADGMFDTAQAFDEKDIPENDRYLAVPPLQYYLMAQTTNVINRDWGGRGVYAEGEVLKVAGINIVKSNHVPSSNVTSGPSAYQGDFSTTVGVAWHKSALGTVKLMDLSSEMEYDIRRQGTLIVSKYAVGHGILRPESAVEFKTS